MIEINQTNKVFRSFCCSANSQPMRTEELNWLTIKTKLRIFGNSFGIVVPLRAVEETKVKEGDEVVVTFRKKKSNVMRKMFGTHKFDKSTDELMKEMDEALYCAKL